MSPLEGILQQRATPAGTTHARHTQEWKAEVIPFLHSF